MNVVTINGRAALVGGRALNVPQSGGLTPEQALNVNKIPQIENEIVKSASVSNGVMSFFNRDGVTLFSVILPSSGGGAQDEPHEPTESLAEHLLMDVPLTTENRTALNDAGYIYYSYPYNNDPSKSIVGRDNLVPIIFPFVYQTLNRTVAEEFDNADITGGYTIVFYSVDDISGYKQDCQLPISNEYGKWSVLVRYPYVTNSDTVALTEHVTEVAKDRWASVPKVSDTVSAQFIVLNGDGTIELYAEDTHIVTLDAPADFKEWAKSTTPWNSMALNSSTIANVYTNFSYAVYDKAFTMEDITDFFTNVTE